MAGQEKACACAMDQINRSRLFNPITTKQILEPLVQQLAYRHLQGPGNLFDVGQARIAFRPLDRANVRAMQTGKLSQGFLGPATHAAEQTNPAGKDFVGGEGLLAL